MVASVDEAIPGQGVERNEPNGNCSTFGRKNILSLNRADSYQRALSSWKWGTVGELQCMCLPCGVVRHLQPGRPAFETFAGLPSPAFWELSRNQPFNRASDVCFSNESTNARHRSRRKGNSILSPTYYRHGNADQRGQPCMRGV